MSQPSKLPDVGTTIFTIMSKLAEDTGAINLSQGFPDFPPPDGLIAAAARHLANGNNQYAPMAGVPALLEQIALKTAHLYGRTVDADHEVTVTSGATEALYSAITAFVHAGDEVIVFDPAYDAYDPAIRLAGGHPVHIPLRGPAFGIDWDRVADAIGPRTRLMILNSPHNPTGAVLDANDMRALSNIVSQHPLLLLSDEVYEHIIFDQRRHESLLRYPELADRALVISSFGKTYHATGWKIGYCVAPANLTVEFRRIHQFVQFCVATPLQNGLADFLASDSLHYQELPGFYQQKRDLFVKLLSESRFHLEPSAGTYFQLADYSAISRETDVQYSRRLTREFGVACIPVSVFYEQPPNQRLLRFCFAKDPATLETAAEKLCAI